MRKSNKPVSSKPRLVFFGNERLATGVNTDVPVLRALVGAGHRIVLVVASHNEAVSRNKRPLEILDVAHAYHIPVELPNKLSRIEDRLRRTGAEAAVLVAFGKIIPQKIIDLFPKGIINIHPSLLPKLRGSTPVETAILNGLAETGVSLMRLSAEMDAGPVYAQKRLALNGKETKAELAQTLLEAGCELLVKNLSGILGGSLEPEPQDETEASYTLLINKSNGLIDFNEPAEVIERRIRAYAGFPKAHAEVYGRDVVIIKARLAASANDGNLVIKCQPGWLEIQELTGPSGRTMSGADFTRGYSTGR